MSKGKATAVANPNIAFIKYWGKADNALNLPANPSLSMNLAALTTVTTVVKDAAGKERAKRLLKNTYDVFVFGGVGFHLGQERLRHHRFPQFKRAADDIELREQLFQGCPPLAAEFGRPPVVLARGPVSA